MQIEKLVPKGVLPPLIRMNRAFGYMALAKCVRESLSSLPPAAHRHAIATVAHCAFVRRRKAKVDCADRHRGSTATAVPP